MARLSQAGSEALVKAWLEGDWDAVEGAFFDCWSGRNIIKARTLPTDWNRFRSFDWGFAGPFSVGWWAVVGDNTPNWDPDHPVAVLPRGAMIRYREWYGQVTNGAGMRLTTEAIAAGILDRERGAGETIADSVADPAIFNHDGGPTIAERYARQGCWFRPADNTRVGQVGALSGWDQMRARILGENGVPMLYVFDTCRDFIRTIPALQHDPMRQEDVDTRGEDHIADETRYACMARPLTLSAKRAPTRSIVGRWGETWKTV